MNKLLKKGFTMKLRINTNISAMNAHMQTRMNNIGMDKTLNSNLRMNKSADDSVGLAIANKLSLQSLGQTTKNETTKPLRDIDFAAESATFAKDTILVQSGSYVITQANAEQKNVMRLLR